MPETPKASPALSPIDATVLEESLHPPLTAFSDEATIAAVSATNLGGGWAVLGTGSPGGRFQGGADVIGALSVTGAVTAASIQVSGTISAQDFIIPNADCAEDFDVGSSEDIEPGTVVVFGENGAVRPSCQPYDKKVAGVISGAGRYKPGIVLDRRADSTGRAPVALLGKVYCRVDAEGQPVEVGDMLTTSLTPGHAMKADDPTRAFGSVIGKALAALGSGQGMIPVLVSLR